MKYVGAQLTFFSVKVHTALGWLFLGRTVRSQSYIVARLCSLQGRVV